MAPRFPVGSMVIYPFHGVAEIVAEEERVIDGVASTYLRLAIAARDVDDRRALVVSVPSDRADEVGLRWPVTHEDAEAILDVLARTDVNVPSAWSRRFKNHQDKLKSGDIFECAEVVRNLSVRTRIKPLAPAEASMYQHALHTLTSELALSWEVDVREAASRVERALQR